MYPSILEVFYGKISKLTDLHHTAAIDAPQDTWQEKGFGVAWNFDDLGYFCGKLTPWKIPTDTLPEFPSIPTINSQGLCQFQGG